jgi:glycosyltransferase involved in cell wall biosynthesis
MRLAVVNDWWQPDLVGGAERSALATAIDLRAWNDICIFVPSSESSWDEVNGIAVCRARIPMARSHPRSHWLMRMRENVAGLAWPSRSRPLIHAIKRFRPDVVLVHNSNRLGPRFLHTLTDALPATPVLHVHHDLSDVCWLRTMFRSGRPCDSVCARCRPRSALAAESHRGVAGCIAVSGYVQRVLESAEIRSRTATKVGYPLVAACGPCSVSPAQGALRVGYIGRIVAEKGIGLLIDAAALAAQERQLELLVAGTGTRRYLQRLKHQASRRGVTVTFLGPVDPAEFSQRVDLVVVPSLWPEPLGRVPLEFAQLGVPTLVTPAGGLPETALQAPQCISVLRDAHPSTLAASILLFPEGWTPSHVSPIRVPTLVERVGEHLASLRANEGGG